MKKKSNEKIRATLKKSFIDCMSCPKCGSNNYKRLKGDTISKGWDSDCFIMWIYKNDSTAKNQKQHDYMVRKYCDDCKELHEYKYTLFTSDHYEVK